jgi:two-component system sensor histidine kinase BaeS
MRSLRVKLTLALLVTGFSGVIIMTVLVQQVTTSEFNNYAAEQARADFIANMAAYYEAYGSWDDMQFAQGRLPIPPPEPDDSQPPPPERSSPPIHIMLVDRDGTIVIPVKGYTPGQTVSDTEMKHADPIVVNDETVGYVIAENDSAWPDRATLEAAYLERINQLLLVAMGGAIALALVLSVLFARSLSKPLREIATAIQSISHGNLDQQVPVRSRDEVGQVAAAFNQMSANLTRANTLRRQMTADIAHELRTPLSVVVGYLASLSEGLLKPSPERFKIMHDEAQHLQRLVEDLRLLSLADAGELPLNLQPVAPAELLNLAAAAFSHQAEQRHITLVVQADPTVRRLRADPDRILQVLSNLISNALRYTPEQGRITLSSRQDEDHIVLSVQDTGPGIDPEHLPHIFERFYRADSSRRQTQNESGLGLAIAKSIVEAHGGQIVVSSTVGHGTMISLVFSTSSLPDSNAPQT